MCDEANEFFRCFSFQSCIQHSFVGNGIQLKKKLTTFPNENCLYFRMKRGKKFADYLNENLQKQKTR